ncbi:hypothetical protein C479_04872 [Halovivax asiaticus JCM 14624]|uniref:DUF7527 domain-containing protein n=1 Tax=Halovivax asiaticus JCM 14624 TaxID=1227490 RepID=M0BP91_9EURY|nr:hypothetical protein [Halovivax asiaticus]ELZ12701.1 hypothetical protein C479_04872 [Halovivax asiaticus JCM 14624]
MDPRTKERVERWESRPFSGGKDALTTLADDTFSGAVTAAGVWAFMLNGRIVGVADGSIETLVDASGTIYEAPADALPLLAAMQTQGGDPRAQYYTNDTALASVDRKLQQGSFTGYVELSEQVLSGDYYLVYYGGKRMAAAYIGNAERLLTGDEAFERADDEIGIYSVIDVDISVTDVPGHASANETATTSPEDAARTNDTAADTAAGTANSAAGTDSTTVAGTGSGDRLSTGESTDPATAVTDTDGPVGQDEPSAGRTPSDETTVNATGTDIEPSETPEETRSEKVADDESVTEDTEVSYSDTETGTADSTAAAESTNAGGQPEEEPATTESTADRPGITTEREPTESSATGITTGEDSTGGDRTTVSGSASSDTGSGDQRTETAPTESDEHDERLKEEERWRETRQIPSIDPESSSEDTNTQSSAGRGSARSQRGQSESDTSRSQSQADSSRTRDGPTPADVASTEQALRSDMLEREDKIDHLTQRVTELEETRKQLVRERDQLQSENEDLTAQVSQLQSTIEELEAELERVKSQPAPTGGDAPATPTESTPSEPERTLTAQQALEQTNVFVRYGSKSQPTLESAHEGEGSRGDLDRNLQLERHTQFDAETTAVDGQPYDSFVEASMQYRFVEWLVGTCLFEIRETGNAADLADLYDVIPRIDRIELAATVSLEEDDRADVPDQVTFDVAAFDKRGTPLVVANCNDSRDPATKGMLEGLEADASAVCANYPDLGAAVVVTSSFFDPGALELAEEVTTSGFLSRSSKVSYVNLSRKQGYHCCLVESRSGGFHMTVPEL